MTKISILIPILVCCWFSVQSQSFDYSITFSASGETSLVETVTVQNMTQCTEETLSGSSTLHLVYSSSIGEIDQNNGFFVYPNPTTDQCIISFPVFESGLVQVKLSEISGKVLYNDEFQMQAGNNKMIVTGLGFGILLLQIKTTQTTFTKKIIGSADENVAPSVNVEFLENSGIIKSSQTKEIVDMDYNPGDILLFKGVSGNYSNFITLVATESTLVTFHFNDATDGDNNHYATVVIGEQTWMAENLRTTTFIDGSPIPKMEDPTEWAQASGPAFCWQENDSLTYAESFGALYNWFTVSNSGKDAMSICPLGWHVSTEDDWVTLGEFLGGNPIAGGKLKTFCGEFWSEPNEGATNISGASIKGTGLRTISGVFGDTMYQSYFWTPKQYLPENARFINVSYITSELNFYDNVLTYGFSVRCVKD
ncbi:MAG TPA: FISUMP domain-containing protein [Bacteroidales bacterium]|nr:FISUMP domain-containing protein [Bacteroidales bacterium]HQP04820.1 FISUMP domain-containing protein [Bacteroidales bacterium]